MNTELEERIKAEIPADDSTSLGEKMLLYWLIRELKPKTVIETGTHRGLTTMYMSSALRDNGIGNLITCDPFSQWDQRGNFAKFPDFPIIYKEQKGTQMLIEHEGGIDFAFIDGFHGKQDVIPEIQALIPKLAKRAVVVFHDCWYENMSDGVNEAIREAGLISMWLPTKNAIRIYSKHEDSPTS